MYTLLTGLTGNPALSPVTLDQFFAQVPVGGNNEPTVRHLQPGSGPAPGKISRGRGRPHRRGRGPISPPSPPPPSATPRP